MKGRVTKLRVSYCCRTKILFLFRRGEANRSGVDSPRIESYSQFAEEGTWDFTRGGSRASQQAEGGRTVGESLLEGSSGKSGLGRVSRLRMASWSNSSGSRA